MNMKELSKKVELVKYGNLYVAKFKNEVVEEYEDFKEQGIVANLDWNQTTELAKHLDVRLPTLQESHDETYKNAKFKEEIMRPYWIWNAEQIFRTGSVQVNGKKINVTIDSSDVPKTLENAKLFKTNNKIWRGSIWSDDNGVSSVRSGWVAIEGRFVANALWPSDRGSAGVAVFAKGKSKVKVAKPKKMSVAELSETVERLESENTKLKAEKQRLESKVQNALRELKD